MSTGDAPLPPYEKDLSVFRGRDMLHTHGGCFLTAIPSGLEAPFGKAAGWGAIIDAEGDVIALVPDVDAYHRRWCRKHGHEFRMPEVIRDILNNA